MVGRYVDFIHKLCEHRNFVRERVIRVVRLSSSLSLLGVEMASERWSLIQFTKCSSGLLLDIPAQCCETELSPAFKNGMFCFVLRSLTTWGNSFQSRVAERDRKGETH